MLALRHGVALDDRAIGTLYLDTGVLPGADAVPRDDRIADILECNRLERCARARVHARTLSRSPAPAMMPPADRSMVMSAIATRLKSCRLMPTFGRRMVPLRMLRSS